MNVKKIKGPPKNEIENEINEFSTVIYFYGGGGDGNDGRLIRICHSVIVFLYVPK